MAQLSCILRRGQFTGAFALGLCLLFTSLTVSAQPAADAKPITTNSAVLTMEGVVQVSRAGGQAWNAALADQVLHIADRIRTGPKSRASVRLSDNSVLRLNQLTTIEIQPAEQAAAAATLNVTAGAAYFFNRGKATDVPFRTPVASGAIRGTEFNIEVKDNGETILTMIDGEVSMENAGGAETFRSGEQGQVTAGQRPRKTAVLDTVNVIQWALYYPGVVDVDEVKFTDAEKQALATSIAAYRSGELLKALSEYPANRTPLTDADKIYRAALVLAVGQSDEAENFLKSLAAPSPLADGLREVIAAVKLKDFTRSSPPSTATEFVAESYYQQAHAQLEAALAAAKSAVEKSPNFGFGWARVAELEFSFGRTAAAMEALDKSLKLAPRNAEAHALQGFLYAAQNRIAMAGNAFDEAMAIDNALGNAWFGRGLTRIRRGDAKAGLQDLQTAAVLEPQRSILRSYLSKAFSNNGDLEQARKEILLAKRFDTNDPTAFLYSALLNQEGNRVNDSIFDLERSKELNDNRAIFRSRQLLDQDRAVRGANLAAMYRDAGMIDLSVREASRAVNSDYANYSAHLFLANSYDDLRGTRQTSARYDSPWASELLLANLLAPVGAGGLSRNVSQQEYSKLFERDRVNFSSSTEYFSYGSWEERASQFGTFGNFGYSLDYLRISDPGLRQNNDTEESDFSAKFKFQLGSKDTLLLQGLWVNGKFGDTAHYYLNAGDLNQRIREKQQPLVFAGLDHEWSPGVHTLVLAGRLSDDLNLSNPFSGALYTSKLAGTKTKTFSTGYSRDLEGYSLDVQQLFVLTHHTIIAGAVYQQADIRAIGGLVSTGPGPITPDAAMALPISTDLERISLYAYEQWQISNPLRLTLGVSYDHLRYPRNVDIPPINSNQAEREQISPKAGLIYTPWKDTHVRSYYTRSLGGVYFDNVFRLEPTQVAGFNQAYRSMIPDTAGGVIPGARFESWGVGLDHSFKSHTYVGVEGSFLHSTADRDLGAFVPPTVVGAPYSISSLPQSLDYIERSAQLSLNQLAGQNFSFGATYKFTHSSLQTHYPYPTTAPNLEGTSAAIAKANLQQINLYTIFNHECGFFSRLEGIWTHQDNRETNPSFLPAGGAPDTDFWQFNAYMGYRFPRRQAEIRIGILNIGDQDYRLNPLTIYTELPRDRTFTASFKFNF